METRTTPELDLAAKIRQLQADRRGHEEAISAIDAVLGRVSDALDVGGAAGDGQGRPAAGPAIEMKGTGRRHRGKFARTAGESVLEFIGRQGDPTTAEINGHWRSEGRRGTSNVTLLWLLKAGAIRRVEDPAVRGSRYVLAGGAGPAARAPQLLKK